MFKEFFDRLPAYAPRDPGLLQGLQLRTAIPAFAFLIPVLLVVVFFVVATLSVTQADPMMRLASGHRGSVPGRIVSVTEEARRCGDSNARQLGYVFSPQPGRNFRGVTEVCVGSAYAHVAEGDSIEVEFLPDNPQINALAGTNRHQEPPLAFFAIFPLFFLFMFAPFFLPQIREVLRARRLVKMGELAQGSVTFVKRRGTFNFPGWPGSTACEVYIDYAGASGERREAVAWCANDWLLSHLAPGALVHIAYMNDKPKRAVLLEAFVR